MPQSASRLETATTNTTNGHRGPSEEARSHLAGRTRQTPGAAEGPGFDYNGAVSAFDPLQLTVSVLAVDQHAQDCDEFRGAVCRGPASTTTPLGRDTLSLSNVRCSRFDSQGMVPAADPEV